LADNLAHDTRVPRNHRPAAREGLAIRLGRRRDHHGSVRAAMAARGPRWRYACALRRAEPARDLPGSWV